jgi:hypothetical protein
MRKKFCLLFLVLLGLPNYAVATQDICGALPPDQFREENNNSIKGDLAGKANLLSRFVGNAELGGKIDSTRKELFAKFPDANAAYMDRYLLYMFCITLFDPKNTQTQPEKMKAIQKFQRQLTKPVMPPDIYSKTYNPPVEQGVVYAVIDKKRQSSIYLAYQWGSAKNEGTINVARANGVVLQLVHSNPGSYPLIIKTDGEIVNLRQYQDDKAPKQWEEDSYEKVSW